MPVPTYDQFIEPILRFLARHPDGALARVAHEAAADQLALTETERQEVIDSGQATYKNRAGWAHDRLKRAGLSESARRGYWKLTAAGVDYAQNNPAPLSAEQIERLATINMVLRLRDLTGESLVVDNTNMSLSQETATISPDDRLEQALAELRESTASELLECLLRVSPGRFEVQLGVQSCRPSTERW